ncbi:MAG: phage major capsid protein [Geopsychrobacter sp.]|nr:phage major capsid protein [Geopsychrobacter sp.]
MPKLRKLERKVKMRGPQVRSFQFDRASSNEEERTMEISFSSETRDVVRWFGIEVLGHGAGEVRMDRINSAGPLLMDHNSRDQIGVIEKAWIDEQTRMGRALVRFGKSTRAQEIWQDVQDGIRANVSFAYDVQRFILEEEGKNGQPDVLRAVDWEPLEISIVSIPADVSVGVGRSMEYGEAREIDIYTTVVEPKKGERTMEKCIHCGRDLEGGACTCPRHLELGQKRQAPIAPAAPAGGAEDALRKKERSRISEIQAVGEAFRQVPGVTDLVRQFVDNGDSVEACQAAILSKMRVNPTGLPAPAAVDLNEREDSEYSLRNAILCALGENEDSRGLEMEVSDEIGKQLGRSTGGIFVPLSLRAPGQVPMQRAPANTLTSGSGGAVVDTTLMPLVDILRNKMMVRSMGAQVLSGLTGNVTFPKQIAAAVLAWVAENPGANVGETDLASFFGTVALSPKSAQATMAVTRQQLQQSSLDMEGLLRNDLGVTGALGVDLAALAGTGASNQPLGILNTSGIGLVSLGTDGALPTYLDIVAMESEVAIDNADLGSLGYLTNAGVRGRLKITEKFSGTTGTPVWEKGSVTGFGEMNGYKAGATNQVPNTLTKGIGTNLNAILFGNWNDLVIGEFGVIEIIVDPYTLKKQGMVELTSFLMVDVCCRRPESFSAIKDAIK